MTNAQEPPAAEAPAGAIAIAEGVQKVVLRVGTGDVPAVHSRCLVHYVGRIAKTGAVFLDTRQESTAGEPVKLVAGRDTVRRETGLHLAVSTMRRGERCHLWVAPRHGYGSEGSFSFPTVPPEAHLTYDVELIDYEAPDEGKEQRDMTYEERLEAAERRRAEGNEAFREGLYDQALGRYRATLSYVDEDLLLQLEGFHYDRAMAVRTPAMLNIAACHLRLGEHESAVAAAAQVLVHDPKNAKALFRRGVARRALGQTEAGLADLEAAYKAAPHDARVAKELGAARRELEAERRAGDAIFKGLVDKAGREGGGLYSDEEDAALPSAAAGGGGGEGVQPGGWLAALLRALCPFIFGRAKPHAA